MVAEVYFGRVQDLRQKVEDLLRSGKLPREIKAALGQNTPAFGCFISRVRAKLGIPSFATGAPRGYRNKDVHEMVLKLKQMGLSYSQIGRVFGFSHQRAQRYIMQQDKRTNVGSGVCSECGLFSKVVHRHHDSYDNPNDFRLVCIKCHPSVTRKMKETAT